MARILASGGKDGSAGGGARHPIDAVVIETVAAVVVVLDTQGRIVEFNRAAEELTGYASGEVCGRVVGETGLIAQEEEPGFRGMVARLNAGECSDRYESHWVTKDGRRRLLSWRNSAVLGDHGEVTHVVATAIDVTDEHRIEAERRASEERFQAAVGSILDVFFVVSPVRDAGGGIVDFRYAYVNDALCALVGFDRERLLGNRVGELFPGFVGSARFEAYHRVAVTGEPCRIDEVADPDVWPDTALAGHVVDVSIVAMGEDLVVSARDVTERRRNEEELRLRAELLDLAHDAVIVRDPAESRVTFWNREAQAIYGYSPEEALERVTHELLATVFPESRQAVDDALAREGRWVGELRHTRKDGTVIFVSSRQALQRAVDGQPSAIIELNSDVTERKLVDVELRRLAAGVDSSADAILSKDRDCRITTWNRGAERLYGYTASEVVGQPVSVLVPADRAGEEQGILDRALRGEDVASYETRRLANDGTVIDVSITVSPIYGPSGDVIGASSIHRDITEQKRAEEELRLRAELLDLAHDAVIVRDPAESRVRFWNREAQAIYGYSPEEALGRVTHELLATVFPESREAVEDALARQGRWGGELRHTRKDGKVIVVSSRQALQRGSDGRPSAVIELNSDITERKRAEEDLAHLAGLLERTEEVSKTGGWEYDVATGELTWTDEVYRIYGVDPASDPTEVTQAIAAYDPESAPVIDAAFKRLVAEGMPYDLELGLLRADGQRVWVRTIGRPVIDDGRVVRVGGNISDVTERKRVEEALRASDQLFRSGFDDSPTGMALTGLDGRLVEVNAAFARMLGFDHPAQLAGVDFARYTHPDDVAANREGIRMMVEEGKPYVAEKRYIRRDGAVVYALMGSTAVLDADGRPSMVFTQVQDITERKQAEAALRASEERFRGGFENSPIGMALVDPNGTYLEVNATHARMLGVEDPHEMVGLSFEDFVHPDDVADTYASIKRLHETGTDHGERRYIRRDGTVVYALFGSSVVRDADGQPSVLFSQVEDITDRTLAEAALRASEERFRGGFENSPIGMTLTGLDGRLVEVNATFARMLGFEDPAELTEQSFTTFIHPDEAAEGPDTIKRIIEQGSYHGERRYIRRDGTVVYALYGATLVRDADGRPSVLFGQVQDITERKLAEAEVRRLNAQLERRVLQRTAELRAANQELEGFAYSLAHDLRAPIRAINGFGAVLAQSHGEELGDRGREMLGRIRRASAKMGELIDAMLLLSGLTRRELSITSVDLSAVAREISEELRARDPAREVEFVIGDGLETVGDERLVRVLMRNLLENAWRFTGPREHARIEVIGAGAGVFAVADNGVGFEMDFAGLLFKPFARLHREDEFPGLGVGLTTVERIVRRHGGAVWGEGRAGEGASFYFTLEPQQRPEHESSEQHSPG